MDRRESLQRLVQALKIASGDFRESIRYYGSFLRAWVDHVLMPAQYPRPLRVLFLSDQSSRTNELQFSPFYWFREALASTLGFVFRPKKLDVAHLPDASALRGYDLIALKMHYKTRPVDAERAAAHIATHKSPGTKLAYFDGIDDLCVLWPSLLNHVDFMVKRHVFRDRLQYLNRFQGGTNLTDYVARLHGSGALFDDSTLSEAVSAQNLAKIRSGITFGMDEWALRLNQSTQRVKSQEERPHDIVCRADVPENWMGYLRKPIEPVMERLRSQGWNVITPEKRVSREHFYEEMASAKIYISPFGYGEICGRDYECVIFGCLLIKPDMGHVEAYPDIYRPYETYVPVAWDYSDLEEKAEYYLRNHEKRNHITAAASRVLKQAYGEEWFIDKVRGLLEKTGLFETR